MESNEISIHEAKLFLALKKTGEQWTTSKELAKQAGVADRTARAHLVKLVKLNLADVAEVFPAHRYRYAEKASKRNAGYVNRLERAAEVFGLK
jgi:predicted ArsR family transcriptional regulator